MDRDCKVNYPAMNCGASLTEGGRVLVCWCKRDEGGVGDREMWSCTVRPCENVVRMIISLIFQLIP